MPSCPIAMPSSTAMVLNSAAKQPSFSTSFLTSCPTWCRCTCPGTNWVNEFAIAMMGLPICSRVIPFACQRARAPAMRRPFVLVALRRSPHRSSADLLLPLLLLLSFLLLIYFLFPNPITLGGIILIPFGLHLLANPLTTSLKLDFPSLWHYSNKFGTAHLA